MKPIEKIFHFLRIAFNWYAFILTGIIITDVFLKGNVTVNEPFLLICAAIALPACILGIIHLRNIKKEREARDMY